MGLRIIKNHIILPVTDPARFEAMFPSVKVVPVNGIYIAALPHTLESCRFVNNLGYSVASPLSMTYNWPGRYKPFEHQKTTTDFLVVNKRSYVLSGMGTGKTASALWAVDYLMRQKEIQKTLIIAPLSTLERVWAQEIFQVLPHRRWHVLHGTRAKRLELLADRKVDFYIINHDGIEIIEEELEKRPDINHVVIDECASFRSAKTKKMKCLFRILNRQKVVRSAWGLTGTPTPNAPTDAYGQVKLITPERCPGSFMGLQLDLMIKVGMFKWVPKKDAAEKVHKLMQPSIRYALEDCVDLPPTIYQERECELSEEQQKHYVEMKRKAFMEVKGETITAVNAGVVLNKLLQISLFGSYNGSGTPVEMDFSPRLKVLKEIIEECNEKVIVFVPFTAALNRFYDELKRQWSVEVVDGSVSAGKRNRIFLDFQTAKEPHLLLAHPETMAHGLTLTAATTIVWASPTTSTEIFLQANARIARPGQTKTTNIVMLHGSEVERKLYQTLKDRRRLQDLVLELVADKGGGDAPA